MADIRILPKVNAPLSTGVVQFGEHLGDPVAYLVVEEEATAAAVDLIGKAVVVSQKSIDPDVLLMCEAMTRLAMDLVRCEQVGIARETVQQARNIVVKMCEMQGIDLPE